MIINCKMCGIETTAVNTKKKYCSKKCWNKTRLNDAQRAKDAASMRARRAANPEKYREACRRWRLKNEYGITKEDFEKLYTYQGGKCHICEKKPKGRLHVDHNHITGEVRGLLCRKCNSAIEYLGESVKALQRAAEYLKFPVFQEMKDEEIRDFT